MSKEVRKQERYPVQFQIPERGRATHEIEAGISHEAAGVIVQEIMERLHFVINEWGTGKLDISNNTVRIHINPAEPYYCLPDDKGLRQNFHIDVHYPVVDTGPYVKVNEIAVRIRDMIFDLMEEYGLYDYGLYDEGNYLRNDYRRKEYDGAKDSSPTAVNGFFGELKLHSQIIYWEKRKEEKSPKFVKCIFKGLTDDGKVKVRQISGEDSGTLSTLDLSENKFVSSLQE